MAAAASSSASTSASRGSCARTTTTWQQHQDQRARSRSSASSGAPPPPPRPPPRRRRNPHAPEITLTHGSVPGRLDLTGFVIVRDPVVDHDIGIGDTADRAVDIVEHRAIPACKTSEFTGEGPSALLRWEIHRLGIFECQLLDIVVGADGKAGVQQVRERSGLASGIVLKIDELGVHNMVEEIVILVATDRVIRVIARQGSTIRDFRCRFWGCLYCRFRPRTGSSRLSRYSRRGTGPRQGTHACSR